MVQRGDMTVIDLEFRRSFCMRIAFPIQVSNAYDILKSLRPHGASVHAQAAANRARDSFHPFKPAETRGLTCICDLLELGADPGRNFVSGNVHLVELTAARMNHHAA